LAGLCSRFVSDVYQDSDRAVYIQKKTTELARYSAEFRHAEEAVAVWNSTLTGITESFGHYSDSLTKEQLAPRNIRATTRELIERYEGARNVLSTSLAVLNNMNFELPALQNLQTKMVQDLNAVDKISEKRIEFLNAPIDGAILAGSSWPR
jgi:hypothetical protein